DTNLSRVHFKNFQVSFTNNLLRVKNHIELAISSRKIKSNRQRKTFNIDPFNTSNDLPLSFRVPCQATASPAAKHRE
ncbi:MAG: hypothetical protein AAEC03_02855, partial [Synechococcus sp.]